MLSLKNEYISALHTVPKTLKHREKVKTGNEVSPVENVQFEDTQLPLGPAVLGSTGFSHKCKF